MPELLLPWRALEAREASGLEIQLRKEAGRRHVLHGLDSKAMGRRIDCDDVIFALSDGRAAQVHLTWSKGPEPDPTWPGTEIFPAMDIWMEDRMVPDHLEWVEGEAEGGFQPRG